MPGTEGNTNSSKNNRLFANTIRRVAVQEPERLRRIVEALYDKAEQGDNQAIKEIGDRLDGKPAQIIAGDDENPFTMIHKIERVILDNPTD